MNFVVEYQGMTVPGTLCENKLGDKAKKDSCWLHCCVFGDALLVIVNHVETAKSPRITAI